MYIALYSYDTQEGFRKHIGNLTNATRDETLRTFDPNSGELAGIGLFAIDNALIYVVNSESGRPLNSGFVKLPKVDGALVNFTGDDFMKIFDTDILLDFSQVFDPSHALSDIFTKVCEAVATNKDPFIAKVPIQFIIPTDTRDTKVIANYSGQYITTNALKFLKVYLSYYGYYIKRSYSPVLDMVTFEFVARSETVTPIRLKDFIHEKTGSDLKVNKTVATIAFKTVTEAPSWVPSDLAYYNSQPTNRASIIASGLPTTEGYSEGFALRVVSGLQWVETDANGFYAAANRSTRTILQYGVNYCYTSVGIEQAKSAAGDVNSYTEGTALAVYYKVATTSEVCTSYPRYIVATPISVQYHRLSGVSYSARPQMPEKVYTLGKDSTIYEGYAPEEQRIYPIVSRIFEAPYLSEAQVSAVYELVNNRYVENILIKTTDLVQPLNLGALELFSMVRCYDKDGTFKDIPVSEKTFVNNGGGDIVTVKLGFKKTLLTEIIKHEVAPTQVVKNASGGSGSTTVVHEDYDIAEGATPPDPSVYDTWFEDIPEE